MKQVFKYSMMGTDSNLDAIVSAFSKQSELAMEGKNTGDDYEKANFALSESIVRYTVEHRALYYHRIFNHIETCICASCMFYRISYN